MPMSIVGTLDGVPFTFRPTFGLYSDNTPYAKGLPPEGMKIEDIFIFQSSLQDFVTCILYIESNIGRFWQSRLVIPFYPGARQDRGNPEGDVLRTKSFVTSIVDRLYPNFAIGTEVVVFDMHSPVSNPERLVNITPAAIIAANPNFNPTPGYYDLIIAPDKGARERAEEVGAIFHTPVVVAEKVRDLSSGLITSYNIGPGFEGLVYEPNKVLVIDDICDGGATFRILADNLPKSTEKHLWVTHGLFSRGIEHLQHNNGYDHIITTNSVYKERGHHGVTVIDLFPGVEL